MKKLIVLGMVLALTFAFSTTVFAAKNGNGIQLRDRLKDGTCTLLAVQQHDRLKDGTCTLLAVQLQDRLRDGSCAL